MKKLSFVLCLAVLAGFSFAQEEGQSIRFDMGTQSSPVMPGFKRVTADDIYSPSRGYGFLEPTCRSFVLEPVKKGPSFMIDTVEHFKRHATPLLVDGVRDTADIRFRADVSPGRYRVTVSMGDLNTPMGCVSLYANDQVIEENITFHHGTKRRISGAAREWTWGSGVTGFYDRVRFTMDAGDGSIVIRLTRDESIYNRLLELEKEKEPKFAKLWKDKGQANEAPYIDIGEPFVDLPLLGVEIRPYVESPVAMVGHGELTYSGSSRSLAGAVEAFNEGRYADAESMAGSAVKEDSVGAGLLWMWLAGWPPCENELELVRKALRVLGEVEEGDRENAVVVEALEAAEIFDRALAFHLNRAAGGSSHFIENAKACHLFQLAQPGDPLHWKSRIHAARCAYQLDPINRGDGAAATADVWFREILERFPENRYAKYYLTREFDSTQGPWAMPDYSEQSAGAPAWAAGTFEAFNRVIDLSEWWIRNKQQPNGAIGGGWGDDVELVGLFGFIGAVSEGSSPLSIQGASKLVNGMYETTTEIDPETGFIWGTADTEHSTEWTGDTLPMMILIEFGNPIWIERALQSAKLMRNLWTGINPKGHRHFRSMYVGGMGVGGVPGYEMDEKYAWRGVQPIERVYWFNQHPEVGKLLLEWADARWGDAMSTDLGKPRGFIPEKVAYADCRPGGPDAEHWYGGPGLQSKGFGHRHPYSMAPLIMAYNISGDPRYLEPIRLEAQWYADHPDVQGNPKAPLGSPEQIKSVMRHADRAWSRLKRSLEDPPDPMAGLSGEGQTMYETRAEECQSGLATFRRYWPLITTEASATDRVGPAGLMFFFDRSVSFQGVGRDLAYIIAEDHQNLLILALYVMRDGEIDIAIRPWNLRAGWTYEVSTAPDEDMDEKPDAPAQTKEFALSHRGEACPLRIEGRTAYLVRFTPLRKEREAGPTPDLAIGERDIEYNTEKAYVMMRVHNIGTAAVEEVPVALYEGTPEDGNLIGRGLISHLDWPRTFDAQTIKFGWRYTPDAPEATFTAVVDPSNEVEEIVETNNQVVRVIRFNEPDAP